MAKKIRIIPELDDSKILKQLRNLGNRREKVKVDVDVDSGNIRNANQQMQQLVTTTVNSNTTFKKLKNTISDTFSSGRLSMFGFLTVLHEISKAGKEAKKTIQDIDKAITDLSIATNMSREATAGLAKEYNSYAKELKSTTTQITSAADDYLRAGKSMSETKKLIEDSIMLSKLGQLETPEATEDLLATMNGFEMSVEEVGSALDAMVAIDMEAATSAGDIATALKYSASSADMAGLSFNKLASMIGTVQDKTQQSAETVGTFMNTLLSRYRNVKIGQFVSDDGEDLSEVETILKSLDIKLRDSNQEFRNFEMVIDEVALKWDTYSSVQKSAIAKAFSGTRQQNRFIALMEGYRKVLELTEVAANSAGTALEKFNNSYKNSLEAKQNTLQASFESMVMNSDMEEVYSGILEATTALVDFINHTNALKGVMTGLAVSGGVKGFLAIRTAINESYIALNQFSNALKLVKQTNISTADFDKLRLLTKNLSDSQMKMVLSSNALGLKQKELLLVNSGLSKEEAQLQLQTWGLTTAQTGLTVTTTTLGNAFKGLWATLVANPFMTLTMVISGLTMAYQSYNQKLEETRQKNIEASESAIDHANSLKDLYTEYSRLSVIQDRSSAEEESFKTVVEDVTKALGDKAKVLEGLAAGTNEYADALANATKEELQSASVDATIGRKSAEEELQADIWSEWKGSKVSVDSNGTGQSLSEEAQRAVNIVSDALKDFETVNKTWNNLSWDISSDNPEEAFEFYNALIKAREDLVLASENDEALLDTEIYKDMNTAISAMSDSLESYISKRYEEEKLNYMATNGIPQTTEEYKAMQDSLMATAGASVDLQDSFKSLLMADFSSLANEIESVSDTVEHITSGNALELWDFTETLSQLDTAKSKLSVLDETFSKIFDPDADTNIGFEDYSAIFETFKDVEGLDISNFVQQLQDAGQDVEKVTSVMQDLIGSYLEHSQILDNVTNENKEFIITMLEEMGVANAEEIVLANLNTQTEVLSLQKQFNTEKGYELVNATLEEINAFINEVNASAEAERALAQLALEKINVNNNPINTSEDIANVIALANAANASAKAIATLKEAQNAVKSNSITRQEWGQSILNQINNGTFDYGYTKLDPTDFQVKSYTPTYSGGSKTQKAIKDTADEVSKAAEKVQEQFEETFDFFDERVEELDNAIDLLKANLENVSGSFAKNTLIDAEIGISKESFRNYSDALDMYTAKANEALSKLPSDIAEKVRNGAVDITDFIGDGNKEVVEAIKEYDQWADKVADCKQELAELKEVIRDLELDKFKNIAQDFKDMFSLRDSSIDIIDKQIALFEEAGELIGSSFFEAQKDQASKQLVLLTQQKEELSKQMSSALSSGNIEVGTDEWLEMVEILNDVEGEILDCKKSIEEFDNAILDLNWQVFKRIQDTLGNFDSELGNLVGLLDDIDVFENGSWTTDAITKLGLLAQQYELAQHQVGQYNDAIDELHKQYMNGSYSATEYVDKLAELSDGQWEAVNSSEAIKDAMMDLHEQRVNEEIEGIEEEISAYEELIQAQIDALKSRKELEDYKRNIQDKSKSVEDLERQISAMAQDSSASTIAKRKLLEEQLSEARQDLEDAEREHSYQSQEEALNKQLEDYRKTREEEISLLEESLNNEEALIAQSFETVKQNASLVGEQITQIAQEHGVYISDALVTSWQQGENAIASYGTVLSAESSAFIRNIIGVENEVWNLQAQANQTADSLAWMFSTRADNLVNELANSYYSEQNLNAMTNALRDSLVNTLERGYNVSSITSGLDSIASSANNVAESASRAAQELARMASAQASASSYSYQDAGIGYGNGVVRVSDGNGNLVAITSLNDAQKKYGAKKGYASGVHNLNKDEIAWTQEKGKEAILSPSRNAILTPLKTGDTVLTKEQTDRLYEWSKLNPDLFVPQSVKNTVANATAMPNVVTKNVNQPVNVHYDSLVTVNGDVNDTNHFIKQVTAVAHNQIVQFNKDISNGAKYRSGLDSRWTHPMKV